MGRIVFSVKLFPEDPALKLDIIKERVKKALPSYASVYRFDEEPIAFGLVALIAQIVFPEYKEGLMDEVEEKLKSVDGMSQSDVLMVRRA